MVSPMQLHTCVMHGGLSIDIVSHVAAGGHHGTMPSAPSAEHSHHQQQGDSHTKQCSCIGDCSAGRTPIARAAAQTLPETPATRSAAASFSYASASFSDSPFLLPFSNGPPRSSSRA
jgi:hypothetical protein